MNNGQYPTNGYDRGDGRAHREEVSAESMGMVVGLSSSLVSQGSALASLSGEHDARSRGSWDGEYCHHLEHLRVDRQGARTRFPFPNVGDCSAGQGSSTPRPSPPSGQLRLPESATVVARAAVCVWESGPSIRRIQLDLRHLPRPFSSPILSGSSPHHLLMGKRLVRAIGEEGRAKGAVVRGRNGPSALPTISKRECTRELPFPWLPPRLPFFPRRLLPS